MVITHCKYDLEQKDQCSDIYICFLVISSICSLIPGRGWNRDQSPPPLGPGWSHDPGPKGLWSQVEPRPETNGGFWQVAAKMRLRPTFSPGWI